MRLTQRFVDAFAGKKAVVTWDEKINAKDVLKTPMLKTPAPSDAKGSDDYFGNGALNNAAAKKEPSSTETLDALRHDLETYQVSVFAFNPDSAQIGPQPESVVVARHQGRSSAESAPPQTDDRCEAALCSYRRRRHAAGRLDTWSHSLGANLCRYKDEGEQADEERSRI